MLVKDICTRDVGACTPEATLAEVARIMWDRDCGIVPVVEPDRHLLGVITDRDICMAVATRDRRASEILARDLLAPNLHTCFPDDVVETPLILMSAEKVRRLPVVDLQGKLAGILSMNDIILHAESDLLNEDEDLPGGEVLRTLQQVSAHASPRVLPSEEVKP